MKTRWQIGLAVVLLALGSVRAADPPAKLGPDVGLEKAIPGVVTRALFTSDIRDHEPVDRLTTVTTDRARIIYFTEIHDMAGQTVRHRWEYQGKVVLEVPIQVGSARWRAYSIKTLDPSLLGEWKVSVVDANDKTLSVNTFSYMSQPDSEPAPTER